MIFKILANYGPLLLAAMGQTLLLALWSLFFACLIGLFVGILSVLKSRVCNIIATIFVDIIRGVPMIVLAFFVYFGVPMLMNDNLNWTAMTGSKFTFTALQAGIICLSLNCGAYMAEIIRAGIQSIDPGQSEAARSLGLTRRQTLQSIVLPQAIKNILPAIANEFVTIIKESSICYTIGVQEIMSAVNSVKSATFSIGEPLIIAACVYFCLTFPTSKIIQYFERRMSRGDRR